MSVSPQFPGPETECVVRVCGKNDEQPCFGKNCPEWQDKHCIYARAKWLVLPEWYMDVLMAGNGNILQKGKSR